MENAMEDNNETKKIEMTAYQLAMKLYNGFYNALMEAVENSIKNFNNAQVQCMKKKSDESQEDGLKKMMDMYYYMGKADAFRELSGRIQKEHDIAGQDLKNWLDVENKCDINEIFDKAIKNTWISFVYRIIKETKNMEVARIFPENDFRGRRVYDKIMRMRGQLASLLEYYGWEGFQLGRKYENDTIKIEDVQDFNPKRFSNTCIETFVPEDYRDF